MRPDEPDVNGPEGERSDATDDAAGEHEAPPPATWAGRARAEADDEPAGEGEESGGEDEGRSGLTDELDGLERELGAEIDGETVADDLDDQESADEDEDPDEHEPADDEDEEEIAAAGAEDEEDVAAGAEDEALAPAAGGETVETDTVALGDREEAREAALAGLRARTAEGEAKRKTGAEAPAAAAPAAPSAPTPSAAVADDDGGPARARPLWPRFLAASLLVVISMATATSVSLLLFLTDLAEGLGGIPGVEEDLTNVEGGDPQTILILGSDRRPDEDAGRSDTTILLRVDPDQGAISLLSIPRDLKVNVPGVGVTKFNEAYAYGGPKLTLRVAKQLTGLDIHHVVNINFTGFADAVNAIDCVYVDVDRRYFIPPESGISEIDIEAGYQRLCGLKALQYVRFRNDDNDLVRSARQQDFLREARQRVSPRAIALERDKRDEMLDIFKEYTTSDESLESPIAVLELIKTFFEARNAQLREVHFPADLGTGRSPYVTASEKAIKDTVAQFLGTEGTPGTPADAEEEPEAPGEAKPQAPKGDGSGGGDKPKDEPEPEPNGPPMIDVAAVGQQYAQQLADTQTKGGKPMLNFPVEYPTQLVPGSTINDATRAFKIDGAGDDEYRGYKFVAGVVVSSAFTEYYGVSGTNWEDPPILENPSETREVDGREYDFFYDGDRLRLVAWDDNKASYWVNNTLLQTLSEEQMLAIASSTRELGQ